MYPFDSLLSDFRTFFFVPTKTLLLLGDEDVTKTDPRSALGMLYSLGKLELEIQEPQQLKQSSQRHEVKTTVTVIDIRRALTQVSEGVLRVPRQQQQRQTQRNLALFLMAAEGLGWPWNAWPSSLRKLVDACLCAAFEDFSTAAFVAPGSDSVSVSATDASADRGSVDSPPASPDTPGAGSSVEGADEARRAIDAKHASSSGSVHPTEDSRSPLALPPLAQVLRALGRLGVSWQQLRGSTRSALCGAVGASLDTPIARASPKVGWLALLSLFLSLSLSL
jgi:hypothetical protein